MLPHNVIHPIKTRAFARQRRRFNAGLIALLASTVAPSVAFANGRFPATNQLHIAQDPDGSRTILMRTTFGILLSRDE
jgi:hypothetical protein